MQTFYLEAGKLGLKEFLTERLQPAPLSPGGGDRITKGGLQKRWQVFLLSVTRLNVGVLCAYWLLTRCKEQRDSPHAGLHELSVDALHVSGREAVFIVSIADGVNPGQVRHVAKQHHPLEERFLRLVTTWRLTRK